MSTRNPFSDGSNVIPFDAGDTFDLIDPGAWAGAEPPPREWMLDGWLPRRRAAYLTGAGGAGKSLLGQQLATCTALGVPFLGLATTQAPAIYLTAEDDADELQRRQRAICHTLGVSESELQMKLFLVSLFGRSDNEMIAFDRDHGLLETPAWAKLRNTARTTLSRLVIVDNVSHVFGGSEIDRTQVTAFANHLNSLALAINGTVLLIGHPNKQGDAYSGSTAWENAFRARLYFDAPKDEAHSDPDARQLSLPKANYARKGSAIEVRWHEGALLRNDELPPSAASEIRKISAATAKNDAFLKCLRIRVEQGRPVGPNIGPNYAPTEFAKMPQAKGTTKDEFKLAMERLYSIGAIRSATQRNKAKGRDLTVVEEVTPNFPEHSPRTLSPNAPERAEIRDPEHSLYPTDILGGPHGEGPPSIHPDELDWT
ncbi:AAA family ATPase [uncultured Novosphingobium sp.]|uniref:AAA family ATPase n=1 Tax=uncultured Novosphingobium sp. TaxID=292277 RepID=UPI003747E52D